LRRPASIVQKQNASGRATVKNKTPRGAYADHPRRKRAVPPMRALARRTATEVMMRRPAAVAYFGGIAVSCVAVYAFCVPARAAPTPLSSLIVLGSTMAGQLALANVCLGGAILWCSYVQRLAFGSLRVAEWHAAWERLVHYTVSQAVLIGAVVEPEWSEMLLWVGLAVLVGVIALYSGLCKDRLE
jgi:hypothetical protein